jgi:hypothetical protein
VHLHRCGYVWSTAARSSAPRAGWSCVPLTGPTEPTFDRLRNDVDVRALSRPRPDRWRFRKSRQPIRSPRPSRALRRGRRVAPWARAAVADRTTLRSVINDPAACSDDRDLVSLLVLPFFGVVALLMAASVRERLLKLAGAILRRRLCSRAWCSATYRATSASRGRARGRETTESQRSSIPCGPGNPIRVAKLHTSCQIDLLHPAAFGHPLTRQRYRWPTITFCVHFSASVFPIFKTLVLSDTAGASD